ncbi:MAG: porin family protein [Bacteroidota bacterium]
MNKLISTCTLMLFVFVTAQSFAQITIGAKAGFNFANMTSQDDENNYAEELPYKTKAGIQLGTTAAYPFSEKLAFEAGLLYSAKGFSEIHSGANVKYKINYLEVPINAVYSFEVKGIKILAFTGPYLGYAISAKMKADKAVLGENGDQTSVKISIGSDKETDEVMPFDFGFNFGAGLEFSVLNVCFQYGLGIANTSPHSENSYSSKNRVLGLTVGYKLGDL